MAILDNQLHSSTETVFTEKMRHWLIASAKWARFISIVGFVFIGLITLAIFSMGTILGYMVSQPGMSSLGGLQSVMFMPFLIIIALFFFPNLYLFQFATYALKGATTFNVEHIETALEKLKSLFKFVGIYLLVVLGLYAIAFLVVLLGMGMS